MRRYDMSVNLVFFIAEFKDSSRRFTRGKRNAAIKGNGAFVIKIIENKQVRSGKTSVRPGRRLPFLSIHPFCKIGVHDVERGLKDQKLPADVKHILRTV